MTIMIMITMMTPPSRPARLLRQSSSYFRKAAASSSALAFASGSPGSRKGKSKSLIHLYGEFHYRGTPGPEGLASDGRPSVPRPRAPPETSDPASTGSQLHIWPRHIVPRRLPQKPTCCNIAPSGLAVARHEGRVSRRFAK